MNELGFSALLLPLTLVLSRDVVSYKGYRVYSVTGKGNKMEKLKFHDEKDRGLVLTERHKFDNEHNPYVVRSYLVPELREEEFLKVLDKAGAQYNMSIEDLEMEIEEERRSLEAASNRKGSVVADVTAKYLSHREIVEFLNEMGRIINPETGAPLAIVEPIGKSLEGREMHLVRISSNHEAQKPVVFFEAGMHAREWTSPSAALYMIQQLVANYTYTGQSLAQMDYYIIPLVNPDGYEFSRAKDRLWRKTRSFNKGFYGVDGNRNFDFHWGESGASGYPASEVYKGPHPFSENETKNVRYAGQKYMKRINLFVSIHAYGPLILYPWSYKRTVPSPYADVMEKIAKRAANTMQPYSETRYQYGPSAVLLYEAAGGADDYFKGVLGVDLAFTFELSSARRDSFIIPTNLIHEIVAEAFEGFKVMAESAVAFHNKITKRRKNSHSYLSNPIFVRSNINCEIKRVTVEV